MKPLRRLSGIFTALGLLCLLSGCGTHDDVLFDTPFATVSDKSKLQTSMTVDKDGNNVLTELCVSVNASRNKFTEPIVIEYEMILGDGLKEGVDFKLQASTASPLTFEPGTYDLPVRILWLKNPDFDGSKDNSLRIRLKSSSLEGMVMGYPGPGEVRREFSFLKK